MFAIPLIAIAGALFGLSVTTYEQAEPWARHLLDAAAVVACFLVLWILGTAQGAAFIWSAIVGVVACVVTTLAVKRFRRRLPKHTD